MEQLVGRTLGRGQYRLVARLGAGGMGAVYEAEQASLERRVAIKVLWPHLSQEAGLLARFYREARIAARLEHAHILPFYGFGEENGLLYLVMRLVRGGSLKDRLHAEGVGRRGWPPREALELARQALPALDYAHRLGVVHRDLKPDNILLEPTDDFAAGYRVFVSDFGIATLAQGEDVELGLTQSGAALGTPAYMAPEQVLNQPVDGRADLYAFGVVLYEVLTGRLPYRGHTPLAVALQHVQDPVPSPRGLNPRLPPAVEEVLLKVLAKQRADRYASAAELLAALSEAVDPARPTRVLRDDRPPGTDATPPRPVAPALAPVGAADRPLGPEPPVPGPGPAAPPARRRRLPARRFGAAAALGLAALVLAGALLARAPGADIPVVGRLGRAAPPVLTPPAPSPGSPAGSAGSDPRSQVVPSAALGDGWTTTKQSTAGSTSDVQVYEVEYASLAGAVRRAGFSLFVARNTATAEAGLEQLRQSAAARGVVFDAYPELGTEGSSLRGRGDVADAAGGTLLSIVHLFRVGATVAAVEAVGPPDQEAALRDAAQRYAVLQRDRLSAAGNSQQAMMMGVLAFCHPRSRVEAQWTYV